MSDVVASDEKSIPAIGSQFALEITGMEITKVKSVSGLALDVADIEHKVVGKNGQEMMVHYPGNTKYDPIKVTRDFTADRSFYDWAKEIMDGSVERRPGAVVRYDFKGDETQRWTFTESWPSEWSLSDLSADGDAVMTESITLQIETLTREK